MTILFGNRAHPECKIPLDADSVDKLVALLRDLALWVRIVVTVGHADGKRKESAVSVEQVANCPVKWLAVSQSAGTLWCPRNSTLRASRTPSG